jgi:hypothetical protein
MCQSGRSDPIVDRWANGRYWLLSVLKSPFPAVCPIGALNAIGATTVPELGNGRKGGARADPGIKLQSSTANPGRPMPNRTWWRSLSVPAEDTHWMHGGTLTGLPPAGDVEFYITLHVAHWKAPGAGSFVSDLTGDRGIRIVFGP